MDPKLDNKSASKNSINKKSFKKVTHIYLNDKYLRKIPKIINFQILLVLYLHNNELDKIENLDLAINLTHLYLQKNKIAKIENLRNLKKLRKLYLGHNCISVIEGLENLDCLEELHVEKQYLDNGNCFCFDPRSIFNIGKTLQVLNISGNKISSISSLSPLKYLLTINASNNQIDDMKDLCDILKNFFYLREAMFSGNPISKKHRYREDIIANVCHLETLDNKNISENTRCFIHRLQNEKLANRLKPAISLADKIGDIAKNYPPALQKAVSVSVLKDRRKLINDSTIADEEFASSHIPWKSLPATRPGILKKPRTSKTIRGAFKQFEKLP